MKIAEIFRQKKPISFEIFPPKGELSTESFHQTLSALSTLSPDYISVTCSAGGSGGRERTAELAGIIRKQYGIESCAHLTCVNSDAQMLREDVQRLHENGIENVLALRGDVIPGASAHVFRYASQLIGNLRGEGFCLGGACYPECHPECAHMEDDIGYLREKVEAGLDFVTTQMFFDNNIFYRYLSKLRDRGVTVPVIAGIMPVTNGRQIARICKISGTYLPSRFKAIVDRYGDRPDAMLDAGVAYATEQIIDLFANGICAVHVYTMNKPEVAERIMSNLRGILGV